MSAQQRGRVAVATQITLGSSRPQCVSFCHFKLHFVLHLVSIVFTFLLGWLMCFLWLLYG